MNSVQVFTRILGGDNPLDATSVHPESYEAATKLLEKLGYASEDIADGKLTGISRQIKNTEKNGAGTGCRRDYSGRYRQGIGKAGQGPS